MDTKLKSCNHMWETMPLTDGEEQWCPQCSGHRTTPPALTPAPATEFTGVVDSGTREEFTTGSVRDSREGKGRFDLLSPIVLTRDAIHMENGAKKYGDRNWEKGQPISRFYDSAMRHMNKFIAGWTDEDHLAAARWNLGAIIHVMQKITDGDLPVDLIDLPNIKLPFETEPK